MGKETQTQKFYKRHRELKNDVINAIILKVGDRKVDIDAGFEDEAGNDLIAIDKEEVTMQGGDVYPLDELGILDAMSLFDMLENE